MSSYNLFRPLRRAGFFPRLCDHSFVLPGIDDVDYITIEKYTGRKVSQSALTRLTEVNTESSLLTRVVKTYIADPSIGIYYHDDKYIAVDIKNKTLRSAGYIQVHKLSEDIQLDVNPKYASLHARIAEVTGAIYRIPALGRTMIRPGAASITFESYRGPHINQILLGDSGYCNSWLEDLEFKLVPKGPKGYLDKYLEEVDDIYYTGLDHETAKRLRALKLRVFKDVRTPNQFVVKDIREDAWYSFKGKVDKNVIKRYHDIFKRKFELTGVTLIGGGTIGVNCIMVQDALRSTHALYLDEYTEKDLGPFIYTFIYTMSSLMEVGSVIVRVTNDRNVVIIFDDKYGRKQVGYMLMPYPEKAHFDHSILKVLTDLS